MEKIIGIVIPPDVKAEIVEFGNKYKCAIVDPHITLVPHEMLEGARGIERKLQSFCLSQPPFKTAIGGPNSEFRGDIEVLFLTAMMGALTVARDRLLRHLKPPSSSGMVRPYVSLIEQEKGGPYDFEKIIAEAKIVFSKPRSISVDSLATYKRSNKDEPYILDMAYPFTGR